MKVKVKHKLGSINEGRTDEMEFTFLSKQKTQYETVMPFTTCKDFLNDKVWAELYKKDAGIVYKFKGTYTKLFEQENYYLAFRIRENPADLTKTWIKSLNENITNLLYLVNDCEEKLKFKNNKTSLMILKSDDYKDFVYILNFNKKWVSSTLLISLLTYLCRIGFELKVRKDIFSIEMEDLQSNEKKFSVNEFKTRFKLLMEKGHLDKCINKDSNINTVHSQGFFRSVKCHPYVLEMKDFSNLLTQWNKPKKE